MTLFSLLAQTSGNFDTIDLIGLIVVGVVVLALWFAFRALERLSQGKDNEPPSEKK